MLAVACAFGTCKPAIKARAIAADLFNEFSPSDDFDITVVAPAREG
jgi:hypothetical protein